MQRRNVLSVGKTAGTALAAFAAGWGYTIAVSALAGEVNHTTPVTTVEFWLNSAAWLAPFAAASALLLWKRSWRVLQYCGAFFLGTWMWVLWPIAPDLRGRPCALGILDTLSQIPARLGTRGSFIIVCVALAIALCALYLWYCRAIRRKYSRLRTALFLAATLLLGIPLMWLRGELSGDWLVNRVQSKTEVGFHALAKDFPNVKEYLALYVSHRDYLVQYIHVWSDMPGKQILYYYLVGFGMGPREIVIFTIIVSSLAAAPLFFVARRFISAEAAAGAAILYFFIPTIPLFLPSSNTMTPFLALTALWLALLCLEKRMPEIAFFTGAFLALLFFYEPIPFALALFLVPWICRSVRAKPWKTILSLEIMAAGFAAVCVAWFVLTGISPLYLAAEAFRLGVRFNQMFHRDYWPFVFQNFRDFLVGVGSVTALLWAVGAGNAAREMFRQPRQALQKIFAGSSSPSLFVFCFTVFIIILAVAGLSRGEVDRLWMFLMPLAVICALWGAERLGARNAVTVMAAWMFFEWLIRSMDALHHWFF